MALLVTFTLAACNRSDDQNFERTSAAFSSKNIIGRIGENSTSARRAPQEGMISIIIFEFSIGRESKGCRGFGICDFEWFPGFKVTNGDNTKHAEVWEYSDGTYDLEFYVNEEVSNPTDPALNIIVDNDLVSSPTPEGKRL